ncbi:hypothetical protein EPR50_G00174330 [Perca flavescens]|uniref:C2H2-type domain-containing protein n=1 Tax=Perca flavescens TaxID=8167 RepID=A0A484CGI6_PERFV|nr:zinc finger protein 518A-like [Perca flavescens]XP_028459052.1 zinc finger protein 518A-like [Perca flavescens]XP_028459053.1 zinc finger protein 518A-like [Perca flavescens]XP_028459054.1 zinc finger protein 518A-like [Perca flavescens]TDH00888.1 hypothetical protein EPR50_G00174330 [Perca flavescens]
MDSVDICATTSRGDNKRRVNKKNRDRHKRLHLRKTAALPPTMQSEDKSGPKKIAEWEQSTVWPSSKKSPQKAQQAQTNDSGNTLRFTCSQCRDNLEYVPKDLVKHFEENHKGSPPVFSCHTCTFSTQVFSYLQVHLLSHKDTFSSCSICNDNVQRTWPEFSAHLTTYHHQNGKYSCEMCQKFSTGDVRLFLEHMYAHNLGLEGAKDLSLHTKGKNKFGPKKTDQTLRCRHCGYEASQKWLITKHVKAVHVCQNGNQRKKKKKKEEEEVCSIAMKPNDPIPKIKPRLTRSAVREMCWLTQDCLSLPGREFLDKYCHLSDPQTTLEETQQFLMKSVAGENGDQKWTKALKTVWSNVPQDVTLHPKSENGIVSNSSDLTVLTVKNKITVAQNGATYAKRLKTMTSSPSSSDKETVSPESAPDDARRAVDQNGCRSESKDRTPCPQTDAKLNNDVSTPAQSEPPECTQMQENRENQELKTDQGIQKHSNKPVEPMHEDGINITSEVKLTNESEEQTSVYKAAPRNKKLRRKRRARSRRADKRSSGLALKIVLKKNPVKEKQWVSQSSLSPSAGGPTDDHHGPPSPHTMLEETAQILPNPLLTGEHQKKRTKASEADPDGPSEAMTLSPQPKPGEEPTPGCAAKPTASENMDGNTPGVSSTQDDADKSLSEAEVDESGSACKTGQSDWTAAAETEVQKGPENAPLPTSGSGTDCYLSGDEMAADGATTRSSCTMSSPVSHPVVTAEDKLNSEDLSLAPSSQPSDEVAERVRGREVPADSCPDVQPEPSPASGRRWQTLPKNLERTLKLVAVNPSQLVKRPAGDQPVVVLNHPDADIPAVARIMEVINRYRGEVQKVVLSRRTVNALAAVDGEAPGANEPTEAPTDSAGHAKTSVRERFMLKLKLRRLSRKKYEVVGAVSPSRDVATKFRCWFCGRVFACQEMWMVHRQRHLMEWKRPDCEKLLNVAHTG